MIESDMYYNSELIRERVNHGRKKSKDEKNCRIKQNQQNEKRNTIADDEKFTMQEQIKLIKKGNQEKVEEWKQLKKI